MADTEQRIRAIIVEKLGVDEADITREASFTNDLGADSLDTVELVMEIEDAFDLMGLYQGVSLYAFAFLSNHLHMMLSATDGGK